MVATAIWLVAAGVGMKVVLDYQVAPGVAARPPEVWPVASEIPRTDGKFSLLLIAHPQCPCTRATLEELAGIIARTDGRLQASVLFVVPPGRDASWAETDLWRTASSLPGVHVALDRDGIESRRFGIATSGQVLLYDPGGRLLFAGGITPGRGHVGDNAGREAVEAALALDRPATNRIAVDTPVFGCALAAAQDQTGEYGQ
jgi:hypothetical protein